jgi:uncharacterized protein
MICGMISTSSPPRPEASTRRSTVRSVDLTGPEGRLEAILNEGSDQARMAAVVCHPHPQGGGTMHNKVVYHAMKALNAPEFGLALPVLRFNFRGTGLSEGAHDGSAEIGDVCAAAAWIENAYKRPLVLVGFSFGAAMALGACCQSPGNVCAVAALGLPMSIAGPRYDYRFLGNCSVPKLFLSGDQDQFASRTDLENTVATTAEPKKLVLLPGADHFFAGQLEAMQNQLASWLKEQKP